ncbi:hypothetical protein GGG16DRAFT_97456 [Schizophyllum commune]
MAAFLKNTTDSIGKGVGAGVKGVGDGLGAGARGVGNGLNAGVRGVGSVASAGASIFNPSTQKEEQQAPEQHPAGSASPSQPPAEQSVDPTAPAAQKTGQQTTQQVPELATNAQASQPQQAESKGFVSGLTSGVTSLGGNVGHGLTTGASAVVNPAVQAGQLGGQFVQSVSSAGFDIGKGVAKTGANVTTGVVKGTVDLAGTAVGGIVNTAAETSGKVFQPIASGLKAVEGLQALGEGLEKVNGLPMAAVSQVSTLTMKAMNMSGVTPTFFDPDADGVVNINDTIKGLIVLGLEDKYATYAAYALHTIFSYSTSNSWVPAMDTNLPIHVNKMNDTRWGKNWGTFERMNWCDDIEVETFFQTAEPKETSAFERWKETFKKGRQYFGVLLLIFEWGTTWPFWMPPQPPQDIPFKDDIGKVVRSVIFPTIFKNFQNSHEGQEKEAPPSPNMPSGATKA